MCAHEVPPRQGNAAHARHALLGARRSAREGWSWGCSQAKTSLLREQLQVLRATAKGTAAAQLTAHAHDFCEPEMPTPQLHVTPIAHSTRSLSSPPAAPRSAPASSGVLSGGVGEMLDVLDDRVLYRTSPRYLCSASRCDQSESSPPGRSVEGGVPAFR